jgi:hypothetical protein
VKNNSLAMLATIGAVLALASMIGYIDPAVCVVEPAQNFASCESVAQQTLTLAGTLATVSAALFVAHLWQKRRTTRARRSAQ